MGHTLRERKQQWREESDISRKFQRMAVERMKSCESVDELAKELGVTRRCLLQVAH